MVDRVKALDSDHQELNRHLRSFSIVKIAQSLDPES